MIDTTGGSATPFLAEIMTVDPSWIDYNGHLNMAYYNVLFDRAMDQLFDRLGIGRAYAEGHRRSLFVAEAHLRYRRELAAGDPVRIAIRVIDVDHKRLHLFAEMHHATAGFLSATSETMSLHVALDDRRTTPFPADILGRLRVMKTAHDRLPAADTVGYRMTMA